MSKAEFMDVRFTVGDREGGDEFYLCTLESGPKSNSVLNDKTLFAIHLKKGTSQDEAKELVHHLNKYVTKIGLTFLK